MKLSSIFFLSALSTYVAAAPFPNHDDHHNGPQKTCASIKKRQSWREFSYKQKKSYIDAVKCLATKPSALSDGETTRLYDDFTYVHNKQTHLIHFVASFLPWHRWWVYIYEQKLVTECGYTGSAVYWAWDEDWAEFKDITRSPMFSPDPVIGLGGNGSTTTNLTLLGAGVVTDGAFANWELLWPQPHLLSRNFTTPALPNADVGSSPYGADYYNTTAMKNLYAINDWNDFRVSLEGTNLYTGPRPIKFGAHGVIHGFTGGDMAFLATQNYSPNDILFFMHHANVDRIWWKWQQAQPSRYVTYSGNAIQNATNNDATLDDMLRYDGLGKDIAVRAVMRTESWPLCYTY